jgi:hypothetical protein
MIAQSASPVIDVISFWPNRSESTSSWGPDDDRVELVCMKADQEIVQASTVPPSAQELLKKEDARFPTGSGAAKLGYGMLGWISAIVVGVTLVQY